MKKCLFTRENLWALILFMVIVILLVVTSSTAPVWIYQEF